MKINTSRKAGFTLVEIMIVVAIIGLLAAIAIPNFVKARKTAQINSCVNNLRQIDAGIQQYALENNKSGSDAVLLTDVSPYLGRGTAGSTINTDFKCSAGGTYAVTDVQSKPTCTKSADGHVLTN